MLVFVVKEIVYIYIFWFKKEIVLSDACQLGIL